MKKLFTLIILLLGSGGKTPAQYLSFDNGVMFANSNYNQGFRVQSIVDLHLVARNTEPLDMGIAAPNLLNAGFTETPVWAKFDPGITNTSCAGYLTGTDNIFIFDSDVNLLGSTLIAGHFTGTITVNANTYTCGGSGTCGFAAVIDPQCQVTDFMKLEGTQSITINKSRWHGLDMLLGVRYQGSFTSWGTTFNATGSGDAALVKLSSLSGPSATVASFSSSGGEIVQCINPYGNDVYTSVLVTPPSGGFMAMTYPGGSQILNTSSHTISNELLHLDNQLNYQSHIVIGSNGGPFEINGYFKYTGGFHLAGTLNYGELFPDPANQAVSISKPAIQAMVVSRYDQSMSYKSSWDKTVQSLLNSYLRKPYNLKTVWIATGQESLPNKQQDEQKSSQVDAAHGVVYIFDDSLTVIDSLVIGSPPGGQGFCMFFDADLDQSGNLYVTGFFNDSIDLDPDPGNQFILAGTFGGYGDILLAKYDATALGITQPAPVQEIRVYPNPFSSVITISIKDPVSVRHDITIIDLTGRKVFTRSFSGQTQLKTTLDLESLSSGVYLLEVKSVNGSFVRKIIRS